MFAQHPFHRIQLADDFTNSHDEGALVLRGVAVLFCFGHTGSVGEDEQAAKNPLSPKGGRGIILPSHAIR